MNRHPTKKTDNSHLEEKILLRHGNLPPTDPLRVLDLFSGNGLLWDEIRRRTGRRLQVLRIDKKTNRRGTYLIGDNQKFMLNVSSLDVIDLDAYGVPFAQLSRVLSTARPNTRVFLTSIQTGMGQLPHGLLIDLGYNKNMIKKCPSLFNKYGSDKILAWLALKGIHEITRYITPDHRKQYCTFTIPAQRPVF